MERYRRNPSCNRLVRCVRCQMMFERGRRSNLRFGLGTAGAHKLTLANSLANLSTEGDFGRETLQEVTTTLADALREHPVPEEKGHPAAPYIELAELVRYQHMRAASDSRNFPRQWQNLKR